MNVHIICVGKLKEKYWREAVAEYSKRLKSYCSLTIHELKESRLAANPSPADEENVKVEEGREILREIEKIEKTGGAGGGAGLHVVTLEVLGKRLTSPQLASHIRDLALSGCGDIAFVIGGSLGLSADVSRRSELKLSFSDMTFPHQMMRVILLEQIYRSFKIIRHEPYHK